jgi:hypothetical protein
MSAREQYRDWLVALGALHAQLRGGRRFDELAGIEEAMEYHQDSRKELREEFGVSTASQAVAWMKEHATATNRVDPAIFKGNRLLSHHRAEIERAGWLAWEAHRFVRFAALARSLGETSLWMSWLATLGARVRASYDSWEQFGFHVLLGDLAQDGVWYDELERAYVHLIEWDESPWRRVAWESFPLERRTRVPVGVSLHVRCAHCMAWVSLSRLAKDAVCASCLSPMLVSKQIWRALAEGTAETSRWPTGFTESEQHYDEDVEFTCEFAVVWPSCGKGHVLGEAAILAGVSAGHVPCATCGDRVPVRKPDAWLAKTTPGVVAAVGEAGPRKVASGTRKVSFTCEQCGAPLASDGTSRNTTCTYCKHDNRLADELWARLHPAPRRAVVTLVFAAG